jgi:hypothetical protein
MTTAFSRQARCAKRELLDRELAEAELDAAPPSELGVGDELLQTLVERPRRRPADEGAAPLAAHDLAALLEAIQRGPEGAARDAQPPRELLLGREALARAVAPGRQPPPQRVLRDVDQR